MLLAIKTISDVKSPISSVRSNAHRARRVRVRRALVRRRELRPASRRVHPRARRNPTRPAASDRIKIRASQMHPPYGRVLLFSLSANCNHFTKTPPHPHKTETNICFEKDLKRSDLCQLARAKSPTDENALSGRGQNIGISTSQ